MIRAILLLCLALGVYADCSAGIATYAAGTVDCTEIIQEAIDAAAAQGGGEVFIPAGHYLVTHLDAFKTGVHVRGAGAYATFIVGQGGAIFETTGHWFYHASLSDLQIVGTSGAATEHGIYLHHVYSSVDYGGPQGLHIHDVRVQNVGGNGFCAEGVWNSRWTDLECDGCGRDGFCMDGGNSNLLTSCYMHHVGSGYAGYRIKGGQAAFVSCNGLDSGSDWGVFGQSTYSGDPVNTYARIVLTSCNVEDFTRYGLRIKVGSQISLSGCAFIGPTAGTVTGISWEYAGGGTTLLDSATYFTTKGASWNNSRAIHVNGGDKPCVLVGTPSGEARPGYYRNDGASADYAITSYP